MSDLASSSIYSMSRRNLMVGTASVAAAAPVLATNAEPAESKMRRLERLRLSFVLGDARQVIGVRAGLRDIFDGRCAGDIAGPVSHVNDGGATGDGGDGGSSGDGDASGGSNKDGDRSAERRR
jgi:hypothetical protein